MTNPAKHAPGAEVAIHLTHDGQALEVTVLDDGRGGTALPAAARGGGFGLVGLTERVTALGGELRTGPRPDCGTRPRRPSATPRRCSPRSRSTSPTSS